MPETRRKQRFRQASGEGRGKTGGKWQNLANPWGDRTSLGDRPTRAHRKGTLTGR
ncbi:hypothetical protein [Phormidium sp. CCY1219]|uniref:hypothetical protein n=1 Tax=Phormidium sp. CCY1219 TaxID=2886104 RepID=UPI002D1EE646|nr:hypothetical protein [Phormidium sp. CCY1219]MEB3828331.1 hypothetical protein [Phormidium sp. CCY1219]